MYKTLWKERMREIKYNFLHWGPWVCHYQLSSEEIESLNKLEEGEDFRKGLAGHLKDEYRLDKTRVFTILLPYLNSYAQGVFDYRRVKLPNGFDLRSAWINRQKKNEFNPPHNHSGLYAFVVWMKIPYSSEEQKKLKFLDGLKDVDKKAGDFEFVYTNLLGDISNYRYPMSPELEGTIILFPAQFMHCVYPFYDCDEPRISLSGNLMISPTSVY